MIFAVTVKLPKNPDHNPRSKVVNTCPANPDAVCTDSTGEHHTLLWQGESLEAAMRHWHAQNVHITRIEEV